MAYDTDIHSADLPVILYALADEMNVLVSHGLKLEGSLTALAAAAHLHGSMIEDLQSLDMLMQHLGELRAFVSVLARLNNAEQLLAVNEALGVLKLRDVSDRLSEALGRPPIAVESSSAGDLDLL